MTFRGPNISLVTLTLLATSACGGSTSLGGGRDAGGFFSPGEDSGAGTNDAGLVSACPSAPPPPGTACTSPGLSCEYGGDPSAACNEVITCSTGFWKSPTSSSNAQCPTPAASGACPATYAAAQSAGVCSSNGAECAYPEGWCACAVDSGPILGPGQAGARWSCDAPQSGCPVPRPRIGSPCTNLTATCDYGSCTLPGGVLLECLGDGVHPSWDPSVYGVCAK